MAHLRNIYYIKMFATNLKHIHPSCQKKALIFCCNYVHISILRDKSLLRPTVSKDPIKTIQMNIFHKNSQRSYSDKIDRSCENKTFLNSYGTKTNENGLSLSHKETNGIELVLSKKNYLNVIKFNRRKSYSNVILENLEELTLLSIEKKQLSEYLQNWDLQKASEQFKSLVNNGVVPDRQLVLNMVEHLAFLGEVEELLELNKLLKEHHLVSNVDFLKCLHYAYCNSGRIVEGITMIKCVLDAVPNGTHTELEADIFFNLLTTKVINHFPHRLNLIKNLIAERNHQDVKSLSPSLWCCYVQAEKFSVADAMLQEDDKLKKMVPAQVTKLIQCLDSLDFNVDRVFIWLLQQQYIKQRLKYSLFDALLLYKCKTEDWNGVLNYLQYAKDQNLKIHKQTLEYFLSKFLNEFPERRLEQLIYAD